MQRVCTIRASGVIPPTVRRVLTCLVVAAAAVACDPWYGCRATMDLPGVTSQQIGDVFAGDPIIAAPASRGEGGPVSDVYFGDASIRAWGVVHAETDGRVHVSVTCHVAEGSPEAVAALALRDRICASISARLPAAGTWKTSGHFIGSAEDRIARLCLLACLLAVPTLIACALVVALRRRPRSPAARAAAPPSPGPPA